MRRWTGTIVIAAWCSWLVACSSNHAPESGGAAEAESAVPDIIATNAFYYYDDVDAAWAFYRDVLGFETSADYGFAKIMRVAPTSYLTLVDAERGMHSTAEPKSVTLAVVTEEVEAWYAYLSGVGVPMRAALRVEEGRAHDGFVAIDPEGYLLEFERFNPHPENERLSPLLSAIEPLAAAPRSQRPSDLRVQATVLWLYYEDLIRAQAFYERALGLEFLVDQGWAKVLGSSRTGFIGLVDGERGLHAATPDKAVTVSFITRSVDAWASHLSSQDGFRARTGEVGDESGRVRVFVGYDPENYFIEWDTFLDVPGNERLLTTLQEG